MSVTVSRNHAKDEDQVKGIIENIAAEMKQEFGFDYGWAGNTMKFSRTGVSGFIRSEPGKVEVKIDKSFFIPLSDSFLRNKVEEYMDRYLG